MPERNWVAIFAAIGLSVVSVGFGSFVTALYQSEERQEREISTYAYGNNGNSRPQQYLTERSGIPAPIESVISNPQPNTGQDHEKRDLAAQEASAAFAWWMVVVSALGFMVTTIGTILLFQQIRLTREAVEDTGKATDAMLEGNRISDEGLAFNKATDERNADLAFLQTRAYVHAAKVDFVEGAGLFGSGLVEVNWHNFGQTPALKTGVMVCVRVIGPGADIAAAFFDAPKIERVNGRAIVQGRKTVGFNDPPITQHDIMGALHKQCRIFLLSRVEYDDSVRGETHITQECWEIRVSQITQPDAAGDFSIGTMFTHMTDFYIAT
jgi:predicted permease